MDATVAAIIDALRAHASPSDAEGQRRFGIDSPIEHLGIRVPALRAIAKPHRRDHDLALALWDVPIHEARHVAAMVDDPEAVTVEQMDTWAGDWASWDLCDGCCTGLFDRTSHALDRVHAWSTREEEFVKRGAFAIVAGLAIHDKRASDATFVDLLPLIEHGSDDERTYVKKGVNWALRQIGKRNAALNAAAIESAERIKATGTRAGRWIASDALRELRSDAVQRRLAAART